MSSLLKRAALFFLISLFIPAGGLFAQVFSDFSGGGQWPDSSGTAGGGSRSLIYKPPASGTLCLDTQGSSYDTLLSVFVDDGRNLGYESLVEVAYNDDENENCVTSYLETRVRKGVTNWITIDAKNGTSGACVLRFGLDADPAISRITNQVINAGSFAGPICFLVADRETPVNKLHLCATSMDPTLVSNSGFYFGGSGTNRTLMISPMPGRYGTNVMTVSVIDEIGNVASTSFVLGVRKVNHAPVAVPDAYTRLPNRPISISIGSLVRNDRDIDGDSVTLTSVASRSHLNAPIIKSGMFVTYAPPIGMNKPDSFTYIITDANGATASGTVNVFVSDGGDMVVY